MENNNKALLYNIGEAAKKMELGLGRNNLYAFLKKRNVIASDDSPNPEFINKGLFEKCIKIQPWNGRPYVVALVTEEGLKFIKELHQAERKIGGENP